MSRHILIDLPDEVYQRAERLARLTNRAVGDVLADTIALSLPPQRNSDAASASMAELSDRELLHLTELQLPPAQDKRLSRLLDRQQAKGLSEAERSELHVLMQAYQEGLLRKSEALVEAVNRGLRDPLEP